MASQGLEGHGGDWASPLHEWEPQGDFEHRGHILKSCLGPLSREWTAGDKGRNRGPCEQLTQATE